MVEINGYEGHYRIDPTDSSIISTPRNGTKGGKLIARINKDGYPYVVLSKNNISKTFKVHRLIALHLVHNPDPIKLICVNHKDGNKRNNSPQNLEWVTYAQNIQHAWRLGLSKGALGENNHSSKMSNASRIEIVKRYANGESQASLAEEFNVTQGNITAIVRAFLKNHFSFGIGH